MKAPDAASAPVTRWVNEVAAHTKPARIHWFHGTAQEIDRLSAEEISTERRTPTRPTMITCARRGELRGGADDMSREEATARFWPAFEGSMRLRTMYVVPYVLAPRCSAEALGVQLTDDLRLAVHLSRTTQIDDSVGNAAHFVRSIHASTTSFAPFICSFVRAREVWAASVSAQDVLDARLHSLRLATVEMRDKDQLPARMAIVAVPRAGARPLYFGVVAPSEFGRPPAVLLGSTRERKSYRVLAAEVAWLGVEDGRLHALLPERVPPTELPEETPTHVPVDAIVFCTRRASARPLIVELPRWAHACYAAAMLTPDADAGSSIDPMGMAAYCATDINEYIDRWLALGSRLRPPPKTFQLNWFLRGPDGSMLWPALFEGWRIIEWITARVEGQGHACSTFAGSVPPVDAIERTGLPMSEETMRLVLDVDPSSWNHELDFHRAGLASLGSGAPLELHREHQLLASRLAEARSAVTRGPEKKQEQP